MMNNRPHPSYPQFADTQTYDKLFYQKRIHEFAETFSANSLLSHQKDPMSGYLINVMQHESVRKQMALCPEATRIFIDTMMDFVTLYLKKMNYLRQRWGAEERDMTEAENWSSHKIRNDWEALITELDQKYGSQGFDKHFYVKEMTRGNGTIAGELWLSLIEEWRKHFNIRFEQQKQQFVSERGNTQIQLLLNNLQGATQHILQHSISSKDFKQTWALMGGHWNSLIFDRLYKTTLLQQRYPILQEITEKMGKKADKNGTQRIATTSGRSETMEHYSKSDIAGISMGHNLSALLPTEMALFLDSQTEDIFLHKYVSNQLQVFDYQSKILNAARSLHSQSATHRGPIVVCVDTSGSMTGAPSQIALSLMMQLSELSEMESRPCFLIAFSVYAKAIDVLLDRTQLLQFFTHQATGDTDARRMLDTLFDLLASNTNYCCADILWITDFRIPIPPTTYLQNIEQLRKSGTRFFGLQLGIAENRWLKYFDEIFNITDVKTKLP